VKVHRCNGASPAYSGWTGELIRALIDDDDCLDGLTSLVDDIVNGRLAEDLRDLILWQNDRGQ